MPSPDDQAHKAQATVTELKKLVEGGGEDTAVQLEGFTEVARCDGKPIVVNVRVTCGTRKFQPPFAPRAAGCESSGRVLHTADPIRAPAATAC